jgi:hypothetical protein
VPWELKKSGGGWFVVTKGTGRRHSRKPLSRERAVAQLRALNASEDVQTMAAHGRRKKSRK